MRLPDNLVSKIPSMWLAMILVCAGISYAGTIVCDANCFSKLASLSSIALNADKAIAGTKAAKACVFHIWHCKSAVQQSKIKATAAKRTK